jgi:hypothetical protein
MIVRTCLLISDDPDDHIEFSEALYDISDDTVLVMVSNPRKAVDLLALKRCIPEYIFLKIGINDFDPEILFETLDDPDLRHVQVIACVEAPEFARFRNPRIAAFLDADASYSELKTFLARLMGANK